MLHLLLCYSYFLHQDFVESSYIFIRIVNWNCPIHASSRNLSGTIKSIRNLLLQIAAQAIIRAVF